MEEFILVQDNDSHWFIVSSEKFEEWCDWCEIPEEDEASWDVPEYAKAVGGSPSLVKFKDYRID